MFPFALGPKNSLGGTARVYQEKIHTSRVYFFLGNIVLELGLLCLMLLSTIFQLHRGGKFYCWRKEAVIA
jgi:hypothetical protein